MSGKLRNSLEKIKDTIRGYYNKGDMGFRIFNKLYYICDKALEEPVRNFEVGTPDEQRLRHYKWCRKHGLDGDGKANCLGRDMSCSRCVLLWSHMSYNTEGENET